MLLCDRLDGSNLRLGHQRVRKSAVPQRRLVLPAEWHSLQLHVPGRVDGSQLFVEATGVEQDNGSEAIMWQEEYVNAKRTG